MPIRKRPTPSAFRFEHQLAHELDAVEEARYCLKAARTGPAGAGPRLPRGPADGEGEAAPEQAYDRAHGNNLLGLAFSGGGIRSATFNLGVIQQLAELRLLHRVDYLSTVSGGGYIGGWLSAWVRRQAGDTAAGTRPGVLEVEDCLRGTGPCVPDPGQSPEPRQVRWLREFSNYLTPRVGALSTDTLSGVATYLRNLFLNQAILAAFGASLLILPWCLAAVLSEVGQGWVGLWLWSAALLLLLGSFLAGYETLRANLGRPAEGPARAGVARAQRRYWVLFASFALAAVVAGVAVTRWPERLEWRWLLLAAAYGLGTAGGWWAAAYRLRAEIRQASPGKRWPWLSLWLLRPLWGLATGMALGGMVLLWAQVAVRCWPDALARPLPAVALGPLVALGAILFTVTLHLGLTGRGLREAGRELWSAHGAHQMRFGVGWLALAGSALFGPLLLMLADTWIATMGGLTWVLTTVAGVLAGSGTSTGVGGKRVPELLARMAPYVFILGILLLLSYGIQRAVWWQWPSGDATLAKELCAPSPRQALYQLELKSDGATTTGGLYAPEAAPQACLQGYLRASASVVDGHAMGLLLAALGLLAASVLLSWRVDVNVFGLNMFYRNRIERCYLGASNPRRHPHPLTGLDPNDTPKLIDLVQGGGVNAGAETPILAQRPFPIINTALNITSSRNLAWQERKAASFSFTPMYCGYEIQDPDGARISGYQQTQDYVRNEEKWLSLGLPVSVSGAAASPNSGYHTSAATAFLMTVFNVRLGWWLQNPRYAEQWQRPGPKFSLLLLLQELAGMTDDASNYVYLSDGGHFENLGIYELVRRRCRYIIACDAGCDPSYGFEDLGNAIRKCKIDLGIGIEIDPREIRPDPQSGHSGGHCAVGRIHYGMVDKGARPGYLLYVKASLTGGEPADILQYASQHAAFPHETTNDQWYSESQFESYRRLGHHAMGAVLTDAIDQAGALGTDREADLEEVFTALRERWYPSCPQVRACFSKHGAAIEAIFERVRRDDNLRFLDAQIYPEWWQLMDPARGEQPAPAPVPTMLPKHPWEIRAGFYLCSSLLQVMESVYHDLDLEEEFEHPDYRGWMNLFRHWSWAGMLRVTWAISASMYGARFQRFCRRRLGLAVGRVQCTEPVILTDGDEVGGLNFLESDHVRHVLRTCFPNGRPPLSVVQLWLKVIDPFGEEGRAALAFPFAFALVDTSGGRRRLLYYRVRDHLRSMGLGRKGLEVLLARGHVQEIAPLDREQQERLSGAIDEVDFSALHRLWTSVAAAAEERDAEGPDPLV